MFFEAPHRIAATLADLAPELGGERRAVVARELTKAHETIYRGTLAELAQRSATEDNFQRGEITIVVAVRADIHRRRTALLRRAVELLSKELSPKQGRGHSRPADRRHTQRGLCARLRHSEET